MVELLVGSGLALSDNSRLVNHLPYPRLVFRVILIVLVVGDVVLIPGVTALFAIVFSHILKLLLSHLNTIEAWRINILVVKLFFFRLRVLLVRLGIEVS